MAELSERDQIRVLTEMLREMYLSEICRQGYTRGDANELFERGYAATAKALGLEAK